MNDSNSADFKHELKQMIVEEADKDVDPADISDDEPLFGPRSNLGLDSIDGLQISMALQTRYGVVITDPKKVRRVVRSINAIDEFLRTAPKHS